MIKPMLAETAEKPFDDPQWLYELKIDGGRCIAYVDGETKLFTRSGNEITAKFPELAPVRTVKPCILDGEITSNTLKFGDFQGRIHKVRELDIRIASKKNPMIYFVFDIIAIGGESLMGKPLIERKAILADNLRSDCAVRILPHFSQGITLFEQTKIAGLEGIIAKRRHSTYQEGRRSRDWLKIKNFQEGTFEIHGVTKGENARGSTFGALILGKDGKFAGCCGTGFDDATLRQLLERLLPLRTTKCELHGLELAKEVLFFSEPRLCCEIRFLEYGTDGHLRFPSYRRLIR